MVTLLKGRMHLLRPFEPFILLSAFMNFCWRRLAIRKCWAILDLVLKHRRGITWMYPAEPLWYWIYFPLLAWYWFWLTDSIGFKPNRCSGITCCPGLSAFWRRFW